MTKFLILIPVYNDWKSLSKLIEEININLTNLNSEISIIIVNDASTDNQSLNLKNIENIHSIQIINMKENRGHARCIASGLKHIYIKKEFDYVIPMDGDGEDRPEEIKEFIKNTKVYPNYTLVGNRIKRSESAVFKICYFFHKIITYSFTGKLITFGNFTCLSKSTVEKMIKDKATWSSFSGSLSKVEKQLKGLPSSRGKRYFGPSKMSFYNLVKHSFSILAVFKSTVIIRSILFYAVYLMLMSKHIGYVTSIPLVLIIIFAISILNISKRENLEELNNSLDNIINIVAIK